MINANVEETSRTNVACLGERPSKKRNIICRIQQHLIDTKCVGRSQITRPSGGKEAGEAATIRTSQDIQCERKREQPGRAAGVEG